LDLVNIFLSKTTIVANPEGLIVAQTTTVKGGGSALLDYIAQSYKEKNIQISFNIPLYTR
jgi:hypothetical protein